MVNPGDWVKPSLFPEFVQIILLVKTTLLRTIIIMEEAISTLNYVKRAQSLTSIKGVGAPLQYDVPAKEAPSAAV